MEKFDLISDKSIGNLIFDDKGSLTVFGGILYIFGCIAFLTSSAKDKKYEDK